MNERYNRQIIFSPFGEAGQRALAEASVLVVGSGGLGCTAASCLVRTGIGRLRLLDSDVVAADNLHRQILFDEGDLGDLKAEVAARRLRVINSEVTIEEHPVRLTEANCAQMLEGMDLVIDATDNLPSRYLLNDGCLRAGVPWIYGGIDGASGMVMRVSPGEGPCFACIFPPPPETDRPADNMGPRAVLGPVPVVIASIQAVEACKLLAGVAEPPALLLFDLWGQSFQRIVVERDPTCRMCGQTSA